MDINRTSGGRLIAMVKQAAEQWYVKLFGGLLAGGVLIWIGWVSAGVQSYHEHDAATKARIVEHDAIRDFIIRNEQAISRIPVLETNQQDMAKQLMNISNVLETISKRLERANVR